MSANSPEKRKYTRVPFQTEALVEGLNEAFRVQAKTRDICLDGLYLITHHRPALNASCDLSITLTGSSSRLAIKVKARVARHDPQGVAFAFEGVDPDAYFHLKNLLLYNAADPEAILRESQP